MYIFTHTHTFPHFPLLVSIVFAKRNEHVVIHFESDCGIQEDIDVVSDIDRHMYLNTPLRLSHAPSDRRTGSHVATALIFIWLPGCHKNNVICTLQYVFQKRHHWVSCYHGNVSVTVRRVTCGSRGWQGAQRALNGLGVVCCHYSRC